MLLRIKTVGLVSVALLCMVALAACGGGEQQQQQQEQGGGQSGGGSGQGSSSSGADIQDVSGRVIATIPDSNRMVFLPEGSEERLQVIITDNTTITVSNQEAGIADFRRGQRGTLTYVARNEKINIARNVNLLPAPEDAPLASERNTPENSPEETT